ncbi:MAG: hypothetical protein ACR2JB_06155 [Bryobacteraceae bacterium]
MSRQPIAIVSTTLIGDETDSHARFLELVVNDVRIANIYAPNGNPIGSDKFLYKLPRMNRPQQSQTTDSGA